MKITGPGPVPKEALNYFRAKVSAPGFDYRDIWKEEHAHAFTVAKAMQADVLDSIRGALDKSLAGGLTFRDFEKNLTPTLQELGWWGKSVMTDPLTGKDETVQLGSPRRLKTIYRANMRTARAAGQWERAERTKKMLPYLLYELGPSREHRDEHVAWHGTLLPVDDPWWTTHMPPNGWGCKCRVRQVGRAEAERLKQNGVPSPDRKQIINPTTGLPTGHREKGRIPVKTEAPKIRMQNWENKRTGQIELVPEGIDPGWDTNPGKVRQQSALAMLTEKLDAAVQPDIARVATHDLVQSPVFKDWMRAPKGYFPVAVLPAASALRIGATARTVRLSAESAGKQAKVHPEITAKEYGMVQEAVDRGREIQDSPTSLVHVLEDEAGYVTVVKATTTGKAAFLQSLRRLSADEAKRSKEIERLLRKEK
jgi:hypothetical protein